MTENEIDLFDAVQKNDISKVQSLIAAGVDVNAEDEKQQTPLHLAVRYSYTETVKLLIASGAEVDAKDHWQQTPLYWAARYGHTEIVKLLIAAGIVRMKIVMVVLHYIGRFKMAILKWLNF